MARLWADPTDGTWHGEEHPGSSEDSANGDIFHLWAGMGLLIGNISKTCYFYGRRGGLGFLSCSFPLFLPPPPFIFCFLLFFVFVFFYGAKGGGVGKS